MDGESTNERIAKERNNKLKRRLDDVVPSTSSAAVGKSTKDATTCDTPAKIQKLSSNYTTNHSEQTVIGTGAKHPKGGLINMIHGVDYQIMLPMHYIARGLLEKYTFKIATEVEEADKFDDLIFSCEREVGFFQAKHKISKITTKITKKELQKPKGDFGIEKYFTSYDQILKNEKFQKLTKDRVLILILITNIGIDDGIKKNFEPITASSMLSRSRILALGSAMERENYYKLKETSELYDAFVQILSKVEKSGTIRANVKTFLDILVFAVNQPNANMLTNMVKKDISAYVEDKDAKVIFRKFESYINMWVRQTEGRCLKREDIVTQIAFWRQKILSHARMDDIKKCGCTFKKSHEVIKNLLNFLMMDNNANVFCLYTRSGTEILSKIKVLQAIENFKSDNIGQHFVFCDIKDLIEQEYTKKCPVKAFRSQTCNIFFLSLHDGQLNCTEVLNRLLQVVIEFNRSDEKAQFVKRLIISVPEKEKSAFVNKFSFNNLGIKSESLDDFDNSFSELDETSRRNLLEKGIKLHEHNITGLLSKEDLAFCIRDEILATLISSELKINDDSSESLRKRSNRHYNEEVKQYYVDRHVVPLIVKRKIKRDSRFHFVREYTPDMNVKIEKEIVVISRNEDVFEQLRKSNKNVHWLEEISSEYSRGYFWVTSQGTLANLRDYVAAQSLDFADPDEEFDLNSCDDSHDDSDNSSDDDSRDDSDSSDDDSDDDLGQQRHVYRVHNESQSIPVTNVSDLKNDVVLISAGPGMGKSFLLSHIAEQVREKDTSLIAFKTNLADYCTELNEMDKENVTLEQAIRFMFIATQIESPQNEQSESVFNLLNVQEDESINFSPNDNFGHLDNLRAMVFCNLYNKKKIVLLLDGFDEVAPDYCEITINLLKTLRKQCKMRKMWVTTRPIDFVEKLEQCLETFVYSLQPLSEDARFTFIKNFWAHTIKSQRTETLPSVDTFLNSLHSKSLSALSNRNFSKVPLHCYMLAKVFIKDFRKFSSQNKGDVSTVSTLTITDLYSQFFDIKFDEILHHSEDLKKPKNKALQEEKKKAKTNLGKLALLQMFDNKIVKELIPDEERTELIDSVTRGIDKIGCVESICDRKPRFVHKTFAEYFAAHYLAEVLLQSVENERRKAAQLLLYESIRSSEYFVLFTFFNYLIVSNCENKEIFNAALAGDISKLSEFENVNEIFDPLNRTPMHLIAIRVPNDLNNFSMITPRVDLKIRQAKKKTCNIFLQCLDQSLSKSSSDTLFAWTPMHYLTMSYKVDKIISLFAYYLNEVKQDILGRTPLMLLIIRNTFIAYWIYNTPINRQCINTQDKYLKTALHYTLETLKVLPSTHYDAYLCMVCFLLKCGACIDIPDNQGVTPMQMIDSTSGFLIFLKFKKRFAECDWDYIDLINWDYIDESVKKYFLEAVPQINCNTFETKTQNRKFELQCIIDILLIKDFYLPILQIPNSEIVFLRYMDYKPFSIANLSECTDLFNNLLTSDNDDQKNIIIFLLTMTKTIGPMLLLKFPHFVDVVDSRGRTALYYAFKNFYKDSVTYLIRNNARVDVPDIKGKMLAHINKSKVFDDSGYDYKKLWFIEELPRDVAREFFSTMNLYPIMTEIDKRFIIYVLSYTRNIADILLSLYPDVVNTKDFEGKTALHYAVEKEDRDTVRYLIDKNAQADIADNNGKYPAYLEKDNEGNVKFPLWICNNARQLSFIDRLPYKAAKPLVLEMALLPERTPSDHKLLKYIFKYLHTIASVLWEEYSDLLRTTSLSENNSYFDCTNVSNEVVCILLEKYCIEDFSDKAVKSNDVLKLVVELFSSVRDNNLSRVQTVLECVEYSCAKPNFVNVNFISMNIKVATCVVNARTKDGGKTALHYVAEKGNAEMAECLLAHGAWYNVPDFQGYTPSQVARRFDNTDVVDLLDMLEVLFNSLNNQELCVSLLTQRSTATVVMTSIEDYCICHCTCFETRKPLFRLIVEKQFNLGTTPFRRFQLILDIHEYVVLYGSQRRYRYLDIERNKVTYIQYKDLYKFPKNMPDAYNYKYRID